MENGLQTAEIAPELAERAVAYIGNLTCVSPNLLAEGLGVDPGTAAAVQDELYRQGHIGPPDADEFRWAEVLTSRY